MGSSSDESSSSDADPRALPRVADRLKLPVYLAVLAGGAERFAYYAVTTPWQNYMQNARNDPDVPGALGLGQSTATSIYNGYLFFTFLMPMPFALLSDLWLGRYKTLLLSLALYVCGCLALLLTSLPFALDRGAGLGGLVASMALIGMGQGGVKATISPFLGDQYSPPQTPRTKEEKNGKKAVTDSAVTIQYIYNLFYWATNVAALSSIPATFLERLCGFWTSYLFGFAAIWVSIIILVSWSSRLVKIAPQGNNLPEIARIVSCAAKSGFKFEHAKSSYQNEKYGRDVPWSDRFVDEVKQGLLVCRLLLGFSLFYLCINQMYNNLISQAGQMDLHGTPNDMIQGLNGLACVLLGPVIQAIYSFLARRRIWLGPITRITLAFVFVGLAMAYAAVLQHFIYSAPPCYDHPRQCGGPGQHPPNDVNIWLQSPVYLIYAVAEILGFVTASEYTYRWAPRDARTIVQAVTQLAACVGSALGMAFSPISKDPYLVIMYTCLAGIMVVSSAAFWWVFAKYDKLDGQSEGLADSDDDLVPASGTRRVVHD